jgi:hypothetical protein
VSLAGAFALQTVGLAVPDAQYPGMSASQVSNEQKLKGWGPVLLLLQFSKSGKRFAGTLLKSIVARFHS